MPRTQRVRTGSGTTLPNCSNGAPHCATSRDSAATSSYNDAYPSATANSAPAHNAGAPSTVAATFAFSCLGDENQDHDRPSHLLGG